MPFGLVKFIFLVLAALGDMGHFSLLTLGFPEQDIEMNVLANRLNQEPEDSVSEVKSQLVHRIKAMREIERSSLVKYSVTATSGFFSNNLARSSYTTMYVGRNADEEFFVERKGLLRGSDFETSFLSEEVKGFLPVSGQYAGLTGKKLRFHRSGRQIQEMPSQSQALDKAYHPFTKGLDTLSRMVLDNNCSVRRAELSEVQTHEFGTPFDALNLTIDTEMCFLSTKRSDGGPDMEGIVVLSGRNAGSYSIWTLGEAKAEWYEVCELMREEDGRLSIRYFDGDYHSPSFLTEYEIFEMAPADGIGAIFANFCFGDGTKVEFLDGNIAYLLKDEWHSLPKEFFPEELSNKKARIQVQTRGSLLALVLFLTWVLGKAYSNKRKKCTNT